jgi:hypothetical protein
VRQLLALVGVSSLVAAPLRKSARLLQLLALAGAALLVAAPLRANVQAPPLPPEVASLAPALELRGGGELTFLGLSIYDGYYWSRVRGFALDQPFALDLHYHRKLDGASIADRSVDEIAKLGYGSPEQRERWREAMRRIFPSVSKGDRLTGLNLPDGTARFFHNGRAIGDIADPGFARAFFAIWLDPRTSRADFRRKLLGE